MVYRNIRFYIVLLGAMLSACAHTTDRLESSLQTWVGKHPDLLVEQWGAPRSQ
jgi:hypothetical protein